MKLSKDNLEKAGGFTGAPVKKDIKWKQGDEEFVMTTYIRKLSYHTAKSDVMSFASDGDAMAGRIASSICDEMGEAVFSVSDITGDGTGRGALSHAITEALLVAINEVNSLGKKSAQSKSSGAN